MDLNICEDYNKLEKKFQLQNIFIPNFVARIELNSEVNNKNLENERTQKLKARFGRNILFPSISYYFHIPKMFLIFFPHTGKNRNRRKSNLLP